MFKDNSNKVETIIKTNEEPQALRLNGIQRLRECGLIVAILISTYLFIALFTFSPADPSWSQTAWGGEIENAGGAIGAWIADTLFFIFGSLAYPLPIIIIALSWVLLRNRADDEPLDLMLLGTRILGVVILLLTSCVLANINFDDIWYFSSGGVIGDVLTSLALPTLNPLGTTLVMLFLWCAGFTLLTGISWLSIVEWLGVVGITAFLWVVRLIRGDKDEEIAPKPSFQESRLRERAEPSFSDFQVVDTENMPQIKLDDKPLPLVDDSTPRRFNIHEPKVRSSITENDSDQIQQSVSLFEDGSIPTKEPISTLLDKEQTKVTTALAKEDPHAEESQDLAALLAAHSSETTAFVSKSRFTHHAETGASPEAVIDDVLMTATPKPIVENVESIKIEPLNLDLAEEESINPSLLTTMFDDIQMNHQEETDDAIMDDEHCHVEDDEVAPTVINHAIAGACIKANEDSGLNSNLIANNMTHNEAPFMSAEEPHNVEINSSVNHEATFNDMNRDDDEIDHNMNDNSDDPIINTHDDFSDENDEQDQDIVAFQQIVSAAQANMAAQQNPFLMQQDLNLPKPTEPLPTLDLLYHPEKKENYIDREALEETARLLEEKLADYKIQAEVVDIFPGPVITRFELDLAPGVKVSRISSLSMDLARSLSATAVRVVEVIPGKPYVGLELPNMNRQTVYLSDVIDSPQFQNAKSPTTVVLGQDIAGDALVADLAKMPHVLVAGTTGSGKSVGVNVMILSMLYKSTPEDVRFIMIDPKMLELSIYEGIPHLLSEVVTDMKDASNALRWCVGEMERRYKLMSVLGVRNLKGFNDKLKMAAAAGHPIHDPLWKEGDSMDAMPPLLEKLPYIVVVVDEFADLMMVVGKKVEELIARLAQKARAAGIHLILATQRPSVDVITGLIKANIPTRVAFTVSTKTDSRTILDQGGAESLLGMGDMLYLPPGSSHTIRVHGAFASDDDVHAVVNNWKARGKPNYIDAITHGDQGPDGLLPGERLESEEDIDPLFDQVVEHVVETRRGSVSGVQRRFKIGYNRAARIVEQLEAQGIVSAPGHNGNREVIAPPTLRD